MPFYSQKLRLSQDYFYNEIFILLKFPTSKTFTMNCRKSSKMHFTIKTQF